MVRVSDLGNSADKFERRAAAAGQDYEQGVSEVSDSDWQSATQAAEGTWEQGVQEAVSEGRFGDGVANPNKSWQQASIQTGSGRFTQGASNAGQTWREQFQDFADALESLTLQPRGPRGSSANFERSRAVGEALHNERQS